MSSYRTVLGFDFGLKKIGVAVGQTITKTAAPVGILSAVKGVPNWSDIKKLINEWGADALIVGLPLNMDRTEQPITRYAKTFGEQLRAQFQLPVFFVDERLTTVAAKAELHETRKGQSRFALADDMSAVLIVESWLTGY